MIFGCAEEEIDLRLNIKKREELLSVIVTLRRLTKNYVNEIRFLLNDIVDVEKYFIVMPCSYSLDEYETLILKEISHMLTENNIYNPQILLLLDEIMMNCKFTNINKVDLNLLENLIYIIPFTYQNMAQKLQEEDERCFYIREETDSDLKREICTKTKQASQAEGFKYFKILFSKLLNFCRLLANSKAYFREMATHDEFLLVIMESLNFDDTYISCQAAQILASFISFKGVGVSKFEKVNKEKLICPKLNMIEHIKRLLKRCDEKVEENPNNLRVLEINGAFLILMLFIKDNTNYDNTNSFDKFIADAIFGPDKSLFHYLDKLALKGIFSVSFGATFIINRALSFYQRSNKEEERKKEEM